LGEILKKNLEKKGKRPVTRQKPVLGIKKGEGESRRKRVLGSKTQGRADTAKPRDKKKKDTEKVVGQQTKADKGK